LKPAAFEYLSPTRLTDALDLLAAHRENAKVLAGGQSLVPTLNFRLGRYDLLVDINRIEELAYIRFEGEVLRIGAMTRQRTIEISPLVRRHAPLLAEATRFVAHLPIRTRGTIGGSLSHADPAAEYPAVLLALDGELTLRSREGLRRVPAADFFVGPLETVLRPDELLVEIAIPAARPGQGFAFEEVSRRHGDFALVGVAAAITVNAGKVTLARLAACGIGSGPVRLREAEQLLEGRSPSPALMREAGQAASRSVSPQSDLHADATYRQHLVGVLLQDVAAKAAADAGERM
jgi:CO/xanthine dehydrogenase FAD-binding subunit